MVVDAVNDSIRSRFQLIVASLSLVVAGLRSAPHLVRSAKTLPVIGVLSGPRPLPTKLR